jgi:hypothetical protein
MHVQIFSNFDFNQLYFSDFKEDSVREELILPIFVALGLCGQASEENREGVMRF